MIDNLTNTDNLTSFTTPKETGGKDRETSALQAWTMDEIRTRRRVEMGAGRKSEQRTKDGIRREGRGSRKKEMEGEGPEGIGKNKWKTPERPISRKRTA
jgi:hypothetical protein